MAIRSMKREERRFTVYTSRFDTESGHLVRMVKLRNFALDGVKSPSPELVDISITNRCGMGCSFCYQDSKPKSDHGPKDLVEKTLKGFDVVPYQIAIGGGEPTTHPDFIEILHTAKELGTVPNYTTAGHNLTPEILKATDEVCGGVAMTFHAWKGADWFVERYLRLREGVTCQVNVHLIADRDIGETLPLLTRLQEKIGKVNLVLLAFYPDVGRSTKLGLMSRYVYTKHLPEAIIQAHDSGMKIAFSEGLLPFFLSRPDLPVDTTFALRSEGFFSCYVGADGRMSRSSFQPESGPSPWHLYERLPDEEFDAYRQRVDAQQPMTIWNFRSQVLWDALGGAFSPHGEACYGCEHNSRCSAPDPFHYFLCAHASHNKIPLP